MADTFLYNQTVTADDLNSIAIDLGVADYSYFPETPPQSAVSALNQITADLIGKGVLFSLNKCNVTVSNNVATVNTGIIVFDSGAKKRITTAQTINLLSNSVNYIYALNDEINNKILLVTNTAFPTSGDFVKLAIVSADGVVSQAQEWCSSTIDFPTKQKFLNLEPIYEVDHSREFGTSAHVTLTVDVGFTNFSCMLAYLTRSKDYSIKGTRYFQELPEGKTQIGNAYYVERSGSKLIFSMVSSDFGYGTLISLLVA